MEANSDTEDRVPHPFATKTWELNRLHCDSTVAAAVALRFIHYNVARLHKTLRIIPAMAAGISDHVWSYEEITAPAD